MCPSVSWCGVLSSSRTEHLLHVRNQRRRLNATKFRGPSRILGFFLMFSIVGFVMTYLIWGFGSGRSQLQQQGYGYYDYEYGDDRRRNRALEGNNVSGLYAARIPNVMRFKDYRKRFWIPFESMVEDILHQNQDQEGNDRHDESQGSAAPVATGKSRFLQENFWNDQEMAADLRSCFCIIFFIVLGIFGRRRRMKTRFAVLKARLEDDKIYYGSSSTTGKRKGRKMDREDKYDGACSHTLCGCYPVDKLQNQEEGEEEDQPDCMNWGFEKISNLFFGKCCRLWVQCFSACALAQEAREVRLLVPPRDQRMDYITHQPFEEYFKNVHLLRRKWKSSGVIKQGEKHGWSAHFGALSKLSRYILITFISVTVVIILAERFNPQAIFSWGDACVLIMTFVQSFIVLGEYFSTI